MSDCLEVAAPYAGDMARVKTGLSNLRLSWKKDSFPKPADIRDAIANTRPTQQFQTYSYLAHPEPDKTLDQRRFDSILTRYLMCALFGGMKRLDLEVYSYERCRQFFCQVYKFSVEDFETGYKDYFVRERKIAYSSREAYKAGMHIEFPSIGEVSPLTDAQVEAIRAVEREEKDSLRVILEGLWKENEL